MPVGSCANTNERQPCPTGGICTNGRLQACNESFRLISGSRDECVLSDASKMILAQVKQLLQEWTSAHYCSIPAKLRYQSIDAKSAPCFDIALLDGGSREVHDIILASPSTMDIVYDDDHSCIGFVNSKALSVVPYKCRFRLGVILFMERHEERALETPKKLWNGLWFTVKFNPLESMAVVVVGVVSVVVFKCSGK